MDPVAETDSKLAFALHVSPDGRASTSSPLTAAESGSNTAVLALISPSIVAEIALTEAAVTSVQLGRSGSQVSFDSSPSGAHFSLSSRDSAHSSGRDLALDRRCIEGLEGASLGAHIAINLRRGSTQGEVAVTAPVTDPAKRVSTVAVFAFTSPSMVAEVALTSPSIFAEGALSEIGGDSSGN